MKMFTLFNCMLTEKKNRLNFFSSVLNTKSFLWQFSIFCIKFQRFYDNFLLFWLNFRHFNNLCFEDQKLLLSRNTSLYVQLQLASALLSTEEVILELGWININDQLRSKFFSKSEQLKCQLNKRDKTKLKTKMKIIVNVNAELTTLVIWPLAYLIMTNI